MRRAKSKHRAERRYLGNRAIATWNGYMFLVVGVVCVCVGLPGILVGDSASWSFLLMGAMWIAASGLMFHVRRRAREHWLQLAVFRECAEKGEHSKPSENVTQANENYDADDRLDLVERPKNNFHHAHRSRPHRA